jgi:hypothetical protein
VSSHVAAQTMLARANQLVLPMRLLVLVGLFVAAFGVRLYQIQDPPLNFQATRQYRSLLLAREYYFEAVGSIPAWQREVAATSAERQGVLEPPLLEHVVALGYRVLGGEVLWLPKVLSSLFWLLGGLCLYRIATRLADPEAAMLSTAFYLFLPFGVLASRSFQPDPLMVMLLLGSVLAMLRWGERPSLARFGLLMGLSAVALLVKPIVLFPVLSVFVALSVARSGVRATVRSPATVAYVLATILPTLAVYSYGILSGTFLVKEAEKTLLPQLVLSGFFWEHWLGYVGSVVSFPVAAAALIGTALLKQRIPRALMFGFWIGYALFCLVVNYNLATHDYYQLQLIPIVALGMAPLAELVLRWIHRARPYLVVRTAVWGVLGLALALAIVRAGTRLAQTDLTREAAVAEEIGAQVNHSTRTLYLAADYGVPLEYHGQLSGAAWPIASDLEWEGLAGAHQLSAEERFQSWFAKDAPAYFIVLDLSELDHQPDLKQFLTHNFALLAQKPEYWLFDLRHPAQ